jgi:hypothetical protein
MFFNALKEEIICPPPEPIADTAESAAEVKLVPAPPPPPRAPSELVSKEQRDYDEFWLGVFRLQLYNTMGSVAKLRKDFKELFHERVGIYIEHDCNQS